MEVTMYNLFNQPNIDRINAQIAELEKMRSQMQQPAPITQNFQLASYSMRYAKSLDEVNKTSVMTDTPFFSQDMTVLWVKSASGDVKSYELKEIIKKDEKDLQIEFLKAQIEELKKNVDDVIKPTKDEKSTDVSDGATSNAKQK